MLHLISSNPCQCVSSIKVGQPIYRKEIIGSSGQIYGHDGQIEIGISCDQDNLKTIIGRQPHWQDPQQTPTKNGRTDSVFGDLYIYLPKQTPIRATAPTNHLRQTSTQTLGSAQWLQIHYERGQSTLTTYAVNGKQGHTINEKDVEYNLYKEAHIRHTKAISDGATNSSPSGWYELLRYGRNLGRSESDKDPLPENAAHWRKIKTIDHQEIWADLNAPDTYKFSDADFLPIMGWKNHCR